MAEIKHTPGPWIWADGYRGLYGAGKNNEVLDYATYEGMWLGHVDEQKANALLIAAAPDLLDIASETRIAAAAYLEDHPHVAPHDCYATGPKTGNEYHDLVRCPGCQAA